MKFIFSLLLSTVILIINPLHSWSQILTREDSLNAGLVRIDRTTLLSGYGEADLEYQLKFKTAKADLKRNVLFIGHKFNSKISLFSEMELEHGFVSSSGNSDAEISMEQMFLKFNINPMNYLVAGLFIPRMGIINENHLPTTFNGMNRPMVEQLLIPSTWRELGIGFYGTSNALGGFNYTISILNGLNSSKFSMANGISNGRGLGNEANSSNMAVHASVLKYHGNWRWQSSYYIGGSAGLTEREADSLQLSYGAMGTPVQVAESNLQYLSKSITMKSLIAWINIKDASSINRAYAQNVAEQSLGGYFELGYNLFNHSQKLQNQNLTIFSRLEWMDLDYRLPTNGIANNEQNRVFITSGIAYHPTNGVVIKADYTYRKTGQRNTDLLATPYPIGQPFYTQQSFFNIGLGYSF